MSEELKPGWLERQMEIVKRKVESWPDCLKVLRFSNSGIVNKYKTPQDTRPPAT